ncbi:MAG: hypothetical protein ACYTBJ_18690 [Planctomycetota bacterium]|jgi:hypothetical protein
MTRKSTVARKVNGEWTTEQRQVIKIEWCDETQLFWGRVRMDSKQKRVNCKELGTTWVMPASFTVDFGNGRTMTKTLASS